jgi:hypothetical protein
LIVDPCAPNGSGIVDQLRAAGFNAVGLPDAMGEFSGDWIITNPPYDRRIVDKIMTRQIERVAAGEFAGFASLNRAGFDFAKSRVDMFANCPQYFGQIKLLFRPYWTESRKAQPIHNYCWHIWIGKRETESPAVLYVG